MITTIPMSRTSHDSEVAKLFDEKSPILVEARFPGMATPPDWYLCHEPHEISAIAECLGAGVELHLRSVWELENSGSPVIVENA